MTIPEDIRAELRAIAVDNRSGALELTERAARVLQELIQRQVEKEVLAEAARGIMEAQPSMAPLIKLGWLATEGGPDDIEDYLRQAREAPLRIAEVLSPFLRGKKVITFSFSSTVLEALKEGSPKEVLCAESRPLCEGIRLATALAEAGIKARIGVDALVMGRVREADLVVVGADAITSTGVVNKVGTYPLAVMAQREGRPFYVLAGPEKVLPPELEGYLRWQAKAPDEVAKVAGVEVQNLYFDLTPLQLVSAIVTPQGLLRPEEMVATL